MKMQTLKLITAITLATTAVTCSIAPVTHAKTPSGTIIKPMKKVTVDYQKAVDGDTIKFKYNKKWYTAKLFHVDAPHYDKKGTYPYAKKARTYLDNSLYNANKVTVAFDKTGLKKDKDGFVHVYAYADGKDIGASLIRKGYARLIKTDNINITRYEKYKPVAKKAKAAKRGIWSVPNYVSNTGFAKVNTTNLKDVVEIPDEKPIASPPTADMNPKPPVDITPMPEIIDANLNPVDYIEKPEAFGYYMLKYKQEDTHIDAVVNTDQDMIALVERMYKELPTSITITSRMYNAQELYNIYDKTTGYYSTGTPVKGGLTNYYADEIGKTLVISDKTNQSFKGHNFNVKTIKVASDAMSNDLAEYIKRDTEKESILAYYDYMFNNFKYDASGYSKMLVGNFAKGSMACNGFSYMTKLVMDNLGLKTDIRLGYSHYWNIIHLSNGERVTFDVTTDIVLGKYQATLGKSTSEHIEISKEINFFNADFLPGKYEHVGAVDMTKPMTPNTSTSVTESNTESNTITQ